MNERRIDRALAIWLTFPPADTGRLSGVISYSSETDGVQFHSYDELMGLLRRLATSGGVGETSAPTLKLAS